MCVVLFAELLPAVFHPAEAGASACAAGLLRQFRSLQHSEVVPTPTHDALPGVFGDAAAPEDRLMYQGHWIPFRVKQDHIGAVSLLKLVATYAQAMHQTLLPGNLQVFGQVPSVFSLVCSDLPVETILQSAGKAISGGGASGLTVALLTYTYLHLLRIQPLPRYQ